MAELPSAIARAQLPDRAKLVAGELWRGVSHDVASMPARRPWVALQVRELARRLNTSSDTIKRGLRNLRHARLIERAVQRGVNGWLLKHPDAPGRRPLADRAGVVVIVIGGQE